MGIGTKGQHSSEDSADEIDKLPSVPRRSIPAAGDTTAPRGRRSARGIRRSYSRESSERSDGRPSRKAASATRSRRHDPQSPQRGARASRRSERATRRKPCLETVHSDDDENDDDGENDHPRCDDDRASPPYFANSLRRILQSPSRRKNLNSRRSRRSPYDENADQSDRTSDSQSPDSPKKKSSSRLRSGAAPRRTSRLPQSKKGDSKFSGRTTKGHDDANDDDDENGDDDEDIVDEGVEGNEVNDNDDDNESGDEDDDEDSENEDEDAEHNDDDKKRDKESRHSRRSMRSFSVQVKKFKQTKSVEVKAVPKSKGRKPPTERGRKEKQVVETRKYRRLTRGSAPYDDESTGDHDAQSIGSKQRSTSHDNDDVEENESSRKKGNDSDENDQDDDGDDNDEEDVNDDDSNENVAPLSERYSDDDRDDDDRMSDSERSDASGERLTHTRKRQMPPGSKKPLGSKGTAPKTRASTLSEQASDDDVESWQQDSSKKSGERLTSRQRALQGESVELEYTKLESPKLKKKRTNEEYDQDEEIELKKQQKARLRQMISEKRNKEKRAAMVDRVLRGVTSKRKKTTMATEAHVAEVGTRLTANEAREGCLRFTSNKKGTTISLPEDATAPFHLLFSVKAQYPPACTRDPKTGKRIFAKAV